ncbi:hypothetical protein [Burkholderia pseudomallei]|uniref:hypothetical protein n=1 Tax=Burkholderia pseudomallei TaxID=28450 RepID=UPI001FCC9191|nr:hypothetical protein [Burkholderia pseudomallei]
MNDQQQSRADALTDEHIATLKLAASAVTPQDIDGAERIESRPDGSYITCPACEGEGCIPFESDYCNYDHVAIGVQFYGVGTEPGAAEAYFRAAKPATILALLDRLERAESALAAPPVEQPAAPPIVSAPASDARECLMDVVSHYDNIVAGFAAQRLAAEEAQDSDTAGYWKREIDVAHRMKAQAERALAAAAPADERAALPQIPDLVKATAWLTMCLRTELSRLDDTTHKALDEVEAQLSCVRAITNGAIDYEAMVPARAAASPAAEAVAWVRKHPDTGELSGDWRWNDAIEQCRKDSGVWFPLGFLRARPALPEEPAAIHQVIHQVWVEETSSWADVTPAYYAERQPSNRRRVYYAPQPAQADAPAHATECPHCDGEGVIEADSGASPCACAQDAQEGMPTFGARRAQADAPAEAFPYQKTFNAIAAATSVEGGHVSISVKAFRDAFGGAVAEAREPIAWVTDDDRAITAAQKQRALADGGATASSVRPYSIPCYLGAVRAPAAEPVAIYQILTEDGAWLDTTREYYERVNSDPALARVVYADSMLSAPPGARQGLTTAHAGGDQ